MPATPIQGGAHLDVPLSNLAVAAFATNQNYIGQQLFPVVPVDKESNKYYTLDKASWLMLHDTKRARKAPPNAIEWQVSSDGYSCKNYATRASNALEDLDNADTAIMLRENTTNLIVEHLLRDYERRIANIVTSGTNVGSYVALTGAGKFSDYVNSDPIATVNTGHAFIRNNTGLIANTVVTDFDTLQILRRHPQLLDLYKNVSGGELTDGQIASLFKVQRILVGTAVYNQGIYGQTSSMANIWGNNLLLAHIRPGISLQTATLGLSMRWTPAGLPAPMQVTRYLDSDPGVKAEFVEGGYYQDEKVVAPELGYLIANTL